MNSQALGIPCISCKIITQTKEPVIIRKTKKGKLHISGVCVICEKTKVKFLNKKQIELIPVELKNMANGDTSTNPKGLEHITDLGESAVSKKEDKFGEAIPIATLLPLVISGITAIPGLITAVKDVVDTIKGEGGFDSELKKLENLQDKLEKLNENFEPDRMSGTGFADIIKNTLPYILQSIPAISQGVSEIMKLFKKKKDTTKLYREQKSPFDENEESEGGKFGNIPIEMLVKEIQARGFSVLV